MVRIYILSTISNEDKYVGLCANDHFNLLEMIALDGLSKAAEWPTDLELFLMKEKGSEQIIPDIFWFHDRLFFSEKPLKLLHAHLTPYGELLPAKYGRWVNAEDFGKPWSQAIHTGYYFNPTRQIKDAIDIEHSVTEQITSKRKMIIQPAFFANKLDPGAKIFVAPQSKHLLFYLETGDEPETLRSLVEKHQLTGLFFLPTWESND